jgi:hypothetical protein
MRLSPILLAVAALAGLGLVSVVGLSLLQPARPLLAEVAFSLDQITPNADGDSDITVIGYTLYRPANVSITFTDTSNGRQFLFRNEAARPANRYQVEFSGVVEGYSLPTDPDGGIIERRLMPNGAYQWQLKAEGENGESMTAEGQLTISQADARAPLMTGFDLTPEVFTPNQDGYDDRISLNIFLIKPAKLTVYLQNAQNGPYYIAERRDGRPAGEGGAHEFDYDGGVDNNTAPPPDGEYTLTALAQDSEGQRVRRQATVTIRDGGLPNIEIVAQSTGNTVTWEAGPYDPRFFSSAEQTGDLIEAPAGVQSTMATLTMQKGDLLSFRFTVYNYGTTPLRTIGPVPGTVYDYEQTNAAMFPAGSREAFSGAWRAGVACERSETSYPWRWAIGAPGELTVVQRGNETLYYLMPGQSATVWGAIRMTTLIRTRNPQACFVALIHEDVELPNRQNRVGEISVRLTE